MIFLRDTLVARGGPMREIVLRNDVRCFERAFNDQCKILGNRGNYLAAGQAVMIGDPITMTYDHRDQLAVPFQWKGNEGFLLHEEVKLSMAPVN